jgi:hypothetical protein
MPILNTGDTVMKRIEVIAGTPAFDDKANESNKAFNK